MRDLRPAPTPQSTTRRERYPGALDARPGSRASPRVIERPPLRLLRDSRDLQSGVDPTGLDEPGDSTGGRVLRLGPSDAPRSRFRGGLAGGALRRVRAYIEDHIGERISLDELARQAGVSRFHFARQFRLSTGESPMGYLRQVRIERSKSILQDRETTIAEVAARLGFSDQSHFTRIFGRLVGVSPGSFARCDEWRPDPVERERACFVGVR
jgi:AraC-like DNA-binding protein